MIIKGQKVVIEFFVLVLAFEFEAVLRLCGVEKGLVEHLKYKLQIAKYKIQKTKSCSYAEQRRGGAMPQMASMERTTPLTTWLSI